MRKCVVIAGVFLVLVVGLVLGRLSSPREAGADCLTPDVEGHAGDQSCLDTNGDGVVNITDGVYVLSFLFLGGPADNCHDYAHQDLDALACMTNCSSDLSACQTERDTTAADLLACQTERDQYKKERDECLAGNCPPAIVNRLLATGQTKCYDNGGNEIPCDSPDFPGQDGFYQAGCPGEGRFIDYQDGTVSDTCTGLMWQKDTASGVYTWQPALQYCETLSLAGHDDWRLPNARELESIVDYGRFNPVIDPVFGAFTAWYWSSTSYAGDLNAAWMVSFAFGGGLGEKTGICYVRAVRNAE